jgi:transcriptional regulator with PAS, ATPase and Fis domain
MSDSALGRDPRHPEQIGEPPIRRHFGRLVGKSPAMRRVYLEIARVAPTDAAVLVVGESGTGKDLVAQLIHESSKRAGGPYLPINCGAMSPSLIESELFGHERGSFTGAMLRHQGHFERTSGGTLFLDEVTEIPVELQARLLRVVETGTLLRVGGEIALQTDVRVIASSNRAPETAMREGRLRRDLYYRLSVFPIHLPPLRNRPGDISLLARAFLAELNHEHGTVKQLPAEVLAAFERYDWPGNVRQLRNTMQRAFILAGEGKDIRYMPGDGAAHAQAEVPTMVGKSLDELNREMILAALAHYGNRRKTAAALGISLKTLYNRLNLYKRESGPSDPGSHA